MASPTPTAGFSFFPFSDVLFSPDPTILMIPVAFLLVLIPGSFLWLAQVVTAIPGSMSLCQAATVSLVNVVASATTTFPVKASDVAFELWVQVYASSGQVFADFSEIGVALVEMGAAVLVCPMVYYEVLRQVPVSEVPTQLIVELRALAFQLFHNVSQIAIAFLEVLMTLLVSTTVSLEVVARALLDVVTTVFAVVTALFAILASLLIILAGGGDLCRP